MSSTAGSISVPLILASPALAVDEMPAATSPQAVPPSAIPLAAARVKPYPWIIHPVFDFFFVAGGGVFVLLGLTWLLRGWSIPVTPQGASAVFLLTLLFLSQHIFADAHTTATYMRLWGSDQDRARFRFYRTWLVYLCVPMFILGLAWPPFTKAIVYAYLIVVFWHYAAQAFGISLIYCYKRGYFLNKTEKQIYKWFILSMAGVVITRILTFREYSPGYYFGVEMPFWGPLPVEIFAGVVTVFIALTAAFIFVILRKAIMQRQMLPWPSMLLIGTVASLGLSSGMTNGLLWFYVPGFFHGSQYIAVSLSYHLKERGMPEGMKARDIAREALAERGRMYIGTVVVTGAFLYIVIPYFFNQLGFNYALVAGLVLGVANFHHFITDAAIWRLRDPHCREILLA